VVASGSRVSAIAESGMGPDHELATPMAPPRIYSAIYSALHHHPNGIAPAPTGGGRREKREEGERE